jgi:hypothetical protein
LLANKFEPVRFARVSTRARGYFSGPTGSARRGHRPISSREYRHPTEFSFSRVLRRTSRNPEYGMRDVDANMRGAVHPENGPQFISRFGIPPPGKGATRSARKHRMYAGTATQKWAAMVDAGEFAAQFRLGERTPKEQASPTISQVRVPRRTGHSGKQARERPRRR